MFLLETRQSLACAQSFALWQQATTEFTQQDHSIIACSCHVGVVLPAHSVRDEPHIQHNANREVATTSPLLSTNRTDRTFFL